MSEETASVLLIDDDGEALLSLSRALKAAGLACSIHATSSVQTAIEMYREKHVEAVVLDLSLNEREGVHSGFNLLAQLLGIDPTCRVIVLTGHASKEHGIESLRRGAAHFIEKPADVLHLAALIRDGIAQANLRRELERLKQEPARNCADIVVGCSDAIKKVQESIVYAAQTSQAVLITGETGTGKGLCARAIHMLGRRRDNKFVRYQPNFTSADLVNSELFGHMKGAFTGALEERRGLFSEAHLGTLFLDEVDELPPESQVTLLGVLQEKSFRPLGSNREVAVDVRLISATNRDVHECIKIGKLRSDLFHRIAHYTIKLPALKDRREDIGILAKSFLEKMREREQLNIFEIEPAAVQKLMDYEWPGNVRQLEAVIEGASLLAQYRGKTAIGVSELGFDSASGRTNSSASGFHERVEEFKRSLVMDALARNGGNQVKAAEELGLDRSSLRRVLGRAQSGESGGSISGKS